jgi:glutamate/tyrosine decarboxylase-like PLP-dependent enzyme
VAEPHEAGTAWSWEAAEIERFGAEVARVIAGYLDGLPGRPVHRAVPWQERNAWAMEDASRTGAPAAAILDRFAAEVAPYPFGNGHPRFYGWVNSPPAVIGVFAEALAAAINPSVAGGDHAAAHLERQVVRWFADLAGLPAGAAGLLVSGASMATLTALAVARNRALSAAGVDVRSSGLQVDAPRARIYATAEAHGCVRKAVELLGIGSANIREIEVDHDFTMRPDDLAAALAADRERGYLPVAVVASAGTVNTGALDPLIAISQVCAESGVWLHVDAAYGGPAVLLIDAYRDALDGLGRADSIAIDPHKWLYVPVDAGLVLLREPGHARDAFSLVPPYLRTPDGEAPWFSEYGFEQTRPFRALKIWMAMLHIGLDGYRELISHDLDLAAHLRDQIALAPDLELLAGELSVACFRYLPPGGRGDGAALDDLNRRLVKAVQVAGRVFLAGTTVRGAYALRTCVVNPGARHADIDVLVSDVREHGARLSGC